MLLSFGLGMEKSFEKEGHIKTKLTKMHEKFRAPLLVLCEIPSFIYCWQSICQLLSNAEEESTPVNTSVR